MKRKIPPIHCAQCGVHVDAVHVEENVATMQMVILVECHGLVEVMTMDKHTWLKVVDAGVTGLAFENKLEDHSDETESHTDETGNVLLLEVHVPRHPA